MIISKDAKKIFDKNPISFYHKDTQQTRNRRASTKNLKLTLYLMVKVGFLTKIRNMTRTSTLAISNQHFNIGSIQGHRAIATTTKGIKIEKKASYLYSKRTSSCT